MSTLPIQHSISNFELSIQPLLDNLESSNSRKLEIVEKKFFQGPGQFLTVPEPISQTQNQIIILFPQLPTELSSEILFLLPIEDLFRMQYICKQFKSFIDTNPKLQIKIAHHYLQTMQSKCNIPIDDLKIDLTNNKLSVEVNNNLCLWKLIQNTSSTSPQLNRTIPWISHLIIKNGEANELTELLIQLQGQTKRLLKLCLLNCEVDSKTIERLQKLLPSEHNLRPPVLYLGNLKPSDCELPSQLSMLSSHVVIIDPDKVNNYSIERFLTEESDVIALSELEQQFQNESLSGELILKKIKELHPIIQAGIVSSIWHSKLSPSTETAPISIHSIQLRVYSFVCQEPYNLAVQGAVKHNLQMLGAAG
jgi:hypothetical protein